MCSCDKACFAWSRVERTIRVLWILITLFLSTSPVFSDHAQELDVIVDNMTFCKAKLDYDYITPQEEVMRVAKIPARYGASSRCMSASGVVVMIEDEKGNNHGCTPHTGKVPKQRWIALVQRGHCQFDQKIHLATIANNASAIVVYNNKDEEDIPIMYHMVSGMVAVFIHKHDGVALADLVDSGVRITLNVRVHNVSASRAHQGHGKASAKGENEADHDHDHGSSGDSAKQTLGLGFADAATSFSPLLYVSLSLVILLIGGLGALLVYGLYRGRNGQRGGGGAATRQSGGGGGGGHHQRNKTSSRQNCLGEARVVYNENGDVRGYLVEPSVATVENGTQRLSSSPRRGPVPPSRRVYTTIVEEDEEEDDH